MSDRSHHRVWPRGTLTALARAADVDERVVTRMLRGEPVRARGARRVIRAALERGIVIPLPAALAREDQR